MKMNYVKLKGFRFHPTDKEAMELLWEKVELGRDSIVQVGDSLVSVITQLKDICQFEPWELPGLSELESGDNVWYFFCSPRYKYRNSKRKNRVTNEGYWKPTGKPRDIVTTTFDYDGNENEISGSRQTLVFYLGRVGNGDDNKTENKTPWVIHELALNLPNHTSLSLCKLKKKSGKASVSRGEEGQSSQLLPSNLGNQYCTNNAIPKDQLTESEAFTKYSEQEEDKFVASLLTNSDEFNSNQDYLDDKNISNSQIEVGANDIPKNLEGLCELINQKPKAAPPPTDDNDDSSRSSILTAKDQSTYSNEGNSLFAENGSSSLAFGNHAAEDSFPVFSLEHPEFDDIYDFWKWNGISMAELFAGSTVPEEPINCDGVQNREFSNNEQNDEFWDSFN